MFPIGEYEDGKAWGVVFVGMCVVYDLFQCGREIAWLDPPEFQPLFGTLRQPILYPFINLGLLLLLSLKLPGSRAQLLPQIKHTHAQGN